MQRQNKMSIHDLYQNNSTIMADSPVEYLRNDMMLNEKIFHPLHIYKRVYIKISSFYLPVWLCSCTGPSVLWGTDTLLGFHPYLKSCDNPGFSRYIDF